MTVLSVREQLIAKILKMDEAEAERVLAFVESKVGTPYEESRLAWGEWLKQTDKLLEELRQKYGDNHFDIQGTLDDIREEASWLRY